MVGGSGNQGGIIVVSCMILFICKKKTFFYIKSYKMTDVHIQDYVIFLYHTCIYLSFSTCI